MTNNNQNIPFFEDRESLIKVYLEKEDFRKLIGQLIWGSQRYYTSIITTLIAITATGISISLSLDLNDYIWLFIFIPILNLYIIFFALNHLIELKLTYQNVKHTCIKLEEKIGLFDKTTFKNVFPEDEYIYNNNYIQRIKKYKKFNKPTNFAQDEANRDIAIKSFKKLYQILGFINILFILFIIILQIPKVISFFNDIS